MDHILPLLLSCLAAAAPAQVARRSPRAAFIALPLHAPLPVLQVLSEGPAPAPAPAHRAHRAPPGRAAGAPQAWRAAPADPTPGEAAAASHAYYTKTLHPQSYHTTSTWYGNQQQPQSSSSSWVARPTAADTAPDVYGQRLPPAPARYATSAPEPAWNRPAPALQSAVRPTPQDAADAREPAEPQDDVPVILYASPSEHGGYRYRRRPAKPRKPEPIVIRIHKHRVVRDD